MIDMPIKTLSRELPEVATEKVHSGLCGRASCHVSNIVPLLHSFHPPPSKGLKLSILITGKIAAIKSV